MKPRPTIAGLMALVALVGLAIAALRSATAWWSSGVFSATLLGFALASAYASQRRGPQRAYWAGFVAFGMAYLLATYIPRPESAIHPELLTGKLIDASFPIIHNAKIEVFDTGLGKKVRVPLTPPMMMFYGEPDLQHYRIIGQSLASLLLGLVGGTATLTFRLTRPGGDAP